MKLDLNSDKKQMQKCFDDLIESNKQSVSYAKEIAEKLNESVELYKAQLNAAIQLSDAIKNIHLMLNERIELFSNDNDMKKLLENLGEFVLSSGAIKMGVLSSGK